MKNNEMPVFAPDQKTEGEIKELKNKRKLYEKNIKKLANRSLVERILNNKDKVNLILYTDALREDALRSSGASPRREDPANNRGSKEDEAKMAADSSLFIKQKNQEGKRPTDFDSEYDSILEGIIDGKKIKITNKIKMGGMDRRSYSGSVDGEELSEEDAKEIYEKYYATAADRTDDIEDALQ